MSFQAMAWAAAQKLPTRDKFVLVMMANYADEIGKCWPSLNRLAAETSMSRSTVQLAIKALEAAGLLRIEHREQDGVSLPNHYFLKLTGVYRDPVHCTDSEEEVYRQPVGGIPTVGTKPIIEPITKDSIVGFEKFWLACPRRIGKEAARKAYEKARKTTSDSELLEGMRRYAATRAGQDEQYTVHPSTWLNQGRWADEPAAGYAQGQGQKREMTEDEKWEAARRFHDFWEAKEKAEAKNGQ
jgi:biotin operon repressor